MNDQLILKAAAIDLAQKRMVAFEDLTRASESITRVEIILNGPNRGVTVEFADYGPRVRRTGALGWTERDRPHDIAAAVKAALRVVGMP